MHFLQNSISHRLQYHQPPYLYKLLKVQPCSSTCITVQLTAVTPHLEISNRSFTKLRSCETVFPRSCISLTPLLPHRPLLSLYWLFLLPNFIFSSKLFSAIFPSHLSSFLSSWTESFPFEDLKDCTDRYRDHPIDSIAAPCNVLNLT